MSIPPPPPGDPFRQQPGMPAPPNAPPGIYPATPPVVYHHYVPMGRTSGLAVASMVLGILWIYWIGSILAVIFGHIAISQSHRDENMRGKGMAIAGLVLGYVGIGVLILAIIIAATASTT